MSKKIRLQDIEAGHDIPPVPIQSRQENTDDSTQRGGTSYPYFTLMAALKLADAVKDLGGARSPVQKSLLAQRLETAESSATLGQQLTSAKIFGMIEGHGEYSLTDLAKRYYFPTTESGKSATLLEIFETPQAFGELIHRFDGDKMPSRDILGNILHRDLGVPESWKDRVAGLFTSSAQHIGVVDEQGFLRFGAAKHAPAGGSTAKAETPTMPIASDQAPKDIPRMSAEGKVHWRYKSIEVLTPEDLDRVLWEKLNGYVKLLEPPA